MSSANNDPAAKLVVGIDLGTTNSVLAICEDGKPRVIANALRENLTPSAVSIDGDHMLVGAAAKARSFTHPELTATGFKRDMGTERRFRLGSHDLMAPELSACVLMSLMADAKAALGRSIDEAVITVPAYFDEGQRRATKEAARIAGLHVERLINEPTAAAIAYGLHHLEGAERTVVVLDLGGGTFDVTVLDIVEGVIEVRSSAGDTRLGGEDFTEELAHHLAEKASLLCGEKIAPGHPAWPRLLQIAERGKRELSRATSWRLKLEDLPRREGTAFRLEAEIERDAVMPRWAKLVERMRAPISRALMDSKAEITTIDEVALVGGATRMPWVVDFARSFFGKEPLGNLDVDEIVARGAAVQAALKEDDKALQDLVVTDVAPFSLGVETTSYQGSVQLNDIFSPILERGTVLPASRVHRFSTVHPQQSEILVKVFQGEHPLCSKNRCLGELEVKNLPRSNKEVQDIDIRFTYDLNGLLEVEVKILSSGHVEALLIEQSPGRMNPLQLHQARLALSRLKTHPREELENMTVLAKAEALYQECTGANRYQLGEAILAFRGALEAQEPAAIDGARLQLQQLLALLA